MQIHSKYGGSSIYIVAACPGALRMQADVEDGPPSKPAEEGTCAHHASEFVFRTGCEISDCVGMSFNGITVTDAMANDLELYVEKVRGILRQHPDAIWMVEPRVVMSSVGEFVFGYIDVFFYIPSLRKMITGDLKYGWETVEATTMQLQHYNVSALDTFQLWDKVDTIESFICQPRADHVDGKIRTVHYTIQDAVNQQAMFKDIVAKSQLHNAPLNAGEHCKYCKANDRCRARLERTFNLLFPDVPWDKLTHAEVSAMYAELPAMKRQIERIASLALQMAKATKAPDGYKLVKARAYHECTDEDALVKDILAHPAASIKDKAELYNMKLKGKTALKSIPGVPKTVVDQYFKAPAEIGVDLVPVSDSRPAIGKGAAIGRFDPVDGCQLPSKFPQVEG